MYQMKMKKRHLDWSRHTFYHQMMSLTLYLCRMNTFSWPNALYILSASPRDREFSLTSHKMLVKWAIRLPNQFLSHNILLQSKNQAKVAYFTKLVILIFGCPEEIRITNFTRMPLKHGFNTICVLVVKALHIYMCVLYSLYVNFNSSTQKVPFEWTMMA